MDFPPLTDELNKICLEEGTRVFKELRAKYPSHDLRSFDITLNSLIFALVCLGYNNVTPGKEKEYAALVASVVCRDLLNNRKNK